MLIRPAKRSFGRMAINAVVPTFSKTQFASAAVAQQLPHHDPAKVSTTKMPLFTKFHPLDDHSLLSSKTKLRRGRARGKQSLVIFDKDGTLICFHSMWVPWAKAVVERLCVASKMPIGEKLYEMLGFCPVQSRVVTGLLAHGTLGQIRERIVALLMEHGMAEGRALELVRNVVRDCDTSCPNTLRQLHDLHKVFSSLKARQIKIAICTADSRPATLSTMRALRLEPYVDFVMCGDDPLSKPKPSPHNALYICQALDVQPEDALMVGDTLADMGMGRSARLGATVGVLSGIGRREELRPQADHIVNHVGELLTIIDGNPDPVDIHISNARPRHHNPCEFLPSCM